jgi:hypothetical protein
MTDGDGQMKGCDVGVLMAEGVGTFVSMPPTSFF